MRVLAPSILGLALSFNAVVAGTTAADKHTDHEQASVLRGIQDGEVKPFLQKSAITRQALTKLGRVLKRYHDKQQLEVGSSSDTISRHDDFSARLLAEVTTNAKPEELALVDNLATSMEQVNAQAFADNMAAIRELLKDQIAMMHQAVLEMEEFKHMVQLFDIASNQLEFRLAQSEHGRQARITVHFREEKSADVVAAPVNEVSSDVTASVNDAVPGNDVSGVVPAAVNEVGEVVDDEAAGEEPLNEGRFAKKTPASSPTPAPVMTTPAPAGTKKDLPEVDSVEFLVFIIFLLGFPSCVIISGFGMCVVFAWNLFQCEVLVTPPPGKEEFCEDFNDSKLVL